MESVPRPRLLLIDDDTQLCGLLERFLAAEHFDVESESDAALGAERASGGAFALILLDVMMPHMDGFEALRRIRARSAVPVLMLTAKGDTLDRVQGLNLGADDYLAKPFEPSELSARIRAILRRTSPANGLAADGRLKIADLELDLGVRSVRRDDEMVELTGVEFDILAVLMAAAGSPVSRESLTRTVLGREFSPFDRSIDTHIYNLRKKIGTLPDGTERIKGIRGAGYRYALPGGPALPGGDAYA